MQAQSTLALRHHYPLKELCTLKIGGPAKVLATVNSLEEMREALMYAQERSEPILILGKGSNCLFDERGFNGMVILNQISFLEELPNCQIRVGAGYSFSRLGALTARNGWSGLEFASGIPASVGGAVFMNAGANGTETCDPLFSVEFVTAQGALTTIPRNQLTFGYRTSPFQQMNGAILAATFLLTESATARPTQLEIVRYRTATQPYNMPSAGCFFRNPPGASAGALIDKMGLKGLRIGDAAVSDLHANFFINAGNASAQDLLSLAKIVRERVFEATGVLLEQEVRYIPYEGFHHA